tara:strand:- start:1289 stop:1843 length:555 start_codon:yes stop_codon:yes gene_type:complete
MKTTLKEDIKNFKRLIGEATDSSNSGSYEQPLNFNMDRPTTICPNTGQPLVGTEVLPNAPSIDVVDVTSGIMHQMPDGTMMPGATHGSPSMIPMNEPTSYEGNMNTTTNPNFDDMPYLSSHPSGWSFEGDEEDFLQSQGIQRPMGPEMEEEDEQAMSDAFDALDDDTDVFQELQMFNEARNFGW